MSSLVNRLTAEAARDGMQHLVVCAVIAGRGAVLLLHRTVDEELEDGYELPGGPAEPGETLDAALVRVVAARTGLTVTSIDGYLGSYDYPETHVGSVRNFQFTVRVAGTSPIVLTRHDRHLWAPCTTEPVRRLLARPVADPG